MNGLSELNGTTVMRQARSEAAATNLAQRRAKVEEMQRLTAQAEAAAKESGPKVDDAKEIVKAAERKLEAARAKLMGVLREQRDRVEAPQQQIDRLRYELRRSAPAIINEVDDRVEAEWQRVRHEIGYTNHPEARQRHMAHVARLTDIRRELDALREQAISESDLTGRIAHLLASVGMRMPGEGVQS